MKIWKIDNYCIGPAVDADYDNTNDTLTDILNTYEHQGATIREIIMEAIGNYKIVYTVEDDSKSYGV